MNMKFTCLTGFFLGALLAASPLRALNVELQTFRVTPDDEAAPPVPSQTFMIGESGAYVTRVQGFKLNPDGAPDLVARYHLVTPDGERHAIPTPVGATGLEQPGQAMVVLQPVFSITFQAEHHVTGVYGVEVEVTDNVARATKKARVPMYLFLTEGAKAQISRPRADAPVDMDGTLFAPGLWEMSVDDLAAAFWPVGLQWTSTARDTIRSTARRAKFLGLEVPDVQFRLEEGRPGEIRMFLFNRGDQGAVTPEWFAEKVEMLTATLTQRANRRPENLGQQVRSTSAQQTSILGWRFENTVWRLEYAESVVRQDDGRRQRRVNQPEYISLTLLPEGTMTRAQMAGRQRANVSAHALRQRVVRESNGDVYLDIPMHDQGEKDYCAAAAAERVLSYLGTSISQHEIAQRIMMESGGASFVGMVRGFRALAQMLGLQLRMLINHDDRSFPRLIDAYNRLAQRERKPLIDFNRPVDPEYGPKTIWEMFDNDLFIRSRIRSPVPVNQFFNMCRQKIDAGIPLIQTCIIGILPEEAELGQAPGGHARLIIGYNAQTREILYTDSWGMGHERKRMPLDHTFAITTGLMTLEPR